MKDWVKTQNSVGLIEMREIRSAHISKQPLCWKKHWGLIAHTNQDFESEADWKFNDGGGCGAVASACVNGHPNIGMKKRQ